LSRTIPRKSAAKIVEFLGKSENKA
jgi:hypothetical protein